MLSDLIDLIKIMFIAATAFFVIIFSVLFIGAFIYYISGAAELEKQKEQALHECFIQEPRTKECEHMLWKEELKNKKSNNGSNNLAIGVAVGTAMGMAMRR